MKKKLTKKIVITGATGDIAQEMVKMLSDEQLILVSRSRERLMELYGGLADVTLLTNDELLSAEQAITCDILINNAGFGLFKSLEELTDSEIMEQFVINTLMPIQLTRQLQPKLQLINIASIAGKLPTAKSTIYAATKAALLAFSDALRLEKPDLIVTTVNTGPVRTKFHKDNEDYLQRVGKNVLTAKQVAGEVVRHLGKKKRELNLPRRLAIVAKLRAIFPSIIDFIALRFFDFK